MSLPELALHKIVETHRSAAPTGDETMLPGALGSESGWEAFTGETKVFQELLWSSTDELGLLMLVGSGWPNTTIGWGA